MTEDKKKRTVLESCLGKALNLAGAVGYSEDSVVSKTILDKPVGTLTLFAFDKGQQLSEHTSPYDAVVQVLDGRTVLRIGGDEVEASVGEIVVMPADVPHSVNAVERFKMLLTMVRS